MISQPSSSMAPERARWLEFRAKTEALAEPLSHAEQYRYDGLILFCSDLTPTTAHEIQNFAVALKKHSLPAGILVRAPAREIINEKKCWSHRPLGVRFNWVITSLASDMTNIPSETLAAQDFFTWVVNPKTSARQIAAWLKQTGVCKIHLEFPFDSQPSQNSWNENAIARFVKTLRSLAENVEFAPPIGWGMPLPQLSAVEPLYPPLDLVVASSFKAKAPAISIVIPTYDRVEFLQTTLLHLFQQHLHRDLFEIRVIDTGSRTVDLDTIREFINEQAFNIDISIYRLRNSTSRTRGDNRFQAGLARNLGVAVSRGFTLSFLDDDILLPRYYLDLVHAELCGPSKTENVALMARRWDLHFHASHGNVKWENLQNGDANTCMRDYGYWQDFHAQAANWMEMPRPWRFLCSHSLSLHRDAFTQAGWFRENFRSYGYEDGELGWRLRQDGVAFKLLDVDVFHLRKKGGAEFDDFRPRKLQLLARSAKVFYRHTLASDVFTHCRYLFRTPLLPWLLFDELSLFLLKRSPLHRLPYLLRARSSKGAAPQTRFSRQ